MSTKEVWFGENQQVILGKCCTRSERVVVRFRDLCDEEGQPLACKHCGGDHYARNVIGVILDGPDVSPDHDPTAAIPSPTEGQQADVQDQRTTILRKAVENVIEQYWYVEREHFILKVKRPINNHIFAALAVLKAWHEGKPFHHYWNPVVEDAKNFRIGLAKSMFQPHPGYKF